jgi:transcriptional regulator with XRE-family HTH domain
VTETAPPPNTPEFAAWLRAKRLAADPSISQERLGRQLGLERKSVGRWEKGGGIETSNYLALLAIFGADPPADAVPPDLTMRLAAIEEQTRKTQLAVDELVRRMIDLTRRLGSVGRDAE